MRSSTRLILAGLLLGMPCGCGETAPNNEAPSKTATSNEAPPGPKTVASGSASKSDDAGRQSTATTIASPAPPLKSAVDLRFVPRQALAAIVVYPGRLLARPPIAHVKMKEPLDELNAAIGVPATEIEQVLLMFVPTPVGDPDEPRSEINGAFELRLDKPHNFAALAKAAIQYGTPEKTEFAGKTYYHRSSKDPARASSPAVYAIDDRTFLCGEESTIKLILAGGGNAHTPLTDLLGKVDSTADLAVVSTSNDQLIKAPQYSLPPPVQAFVQVAHALGGDYGATASAKFAPNLSLRFSLVAKDSVGADKIVALMPQAKQQAGMIQAALGQQATQAPANSKPMLEYAAAALDKIVAAFPAQQKGNELFMQINDLGSLDKFATDVLTPLIGRGERNKSAYASARNLQTLSLALISYQATHGQLPAPTIWSEGGKPLLSWRVSILPFINEKSLYAQFHLDEPWDSPNNKPLIAKMPQVFHDLSGNPLAVGQTRYLLPIGKGAMFASDNAPPDKSLDPLKHDRCLAVVEVGEDKAVTWTQPGDMHFDSANPLAALGAIPEEGLAASNLSMAFMQIPKNISVGEFRRLVQGGPAPLPQDPESLSQQALVNKYKKLGARIEMFAARDGGTNVAVYLEGKDISDADLKDLVGFKNLTLLSLNGTNVTDTGIKNIAAIPALTVLSINFCPQVTSAGLKEISGLKNLTSLSVSFSKLDDAGLKEIGKLTTLKSLDIEKSQVTDAGLAELADLKKLESLNLFGDNVTGTGFKSLAGLTKLAKLELTYAKVADAGLEKIGTLTALKDLQLAGTKVTDAGLKGLANLTNLQTLDLHETDLTGVGFGDLARLERLESLELTRTKVSDAGLKEIGKLTGLNILYLSYTPITDAGLKELVKLDKLQLLTVNETHVTDAGVAELKKLLPNCKVRSK